MLLIKAILQMLDILWHYQQRMVALMVGVPSIQLDGHTQDLLGLMV